MKSFVKEFKEFISKGNVMSMAVGIIVGGAFTAIVTAVVENLITPLIGIVCGGMDFSAIGFYVGEAFFGIGNVLNAILTFLATALVLFIILKSFNKMQAEAEKLAKRNQEEEEAAEPVPAEPSAEEKLLTEIRDLLKEGK